MKRLRLFVFAFCAGAFGAGLSMSASAQNIPQNDPRNPGNCPAWAQCPQGQQGPRNSQRPEINDFKNNPGHIGPDGLSLRDRTIRERMKERWEQMSPAEREALRRKRPNQIPGGDSSSITR